MVDERVSTIGASEVTTISPVAAAISRLKFTGTVEPEAMATSATS